MEDRFLYIFLDEAGDFDFSDHGSPFLQVGAITKERPFHACKALNELKYDLVEQGLDIEYFHATDDKQATRDKVFSIIERCLDGVRFDSVYLDKRASRETTRRGHGFYVPLLRQLLLHLIACHDVAIYKEVIVFTDRIPVNKKRNEVEKAVKQTLSRALPKGTRYRIYHHDSKSNFDLQIADYFNWAAFRYLRDGDERSYTIIRPAVHETRELKFESEIDGGE